MGLKWNFEKRFGFWELDLSQFSREEEWCAAGFIQITPEVNDIVGVTGYKLDGPQAKCSQVYQSFERAKEVGEVLYNFSKANPLSTVPINVSDIDKHHIEFIGDGLPDLYTIKCPQMILPFK